MKFSIITPSHRYQPYIEELYQSIKSQTYTDWEWILYLNGSFRKEQLSEEILKDKKVKIYTNYEGNTNIGFVKNRAFSIGVGDVLVEADHDDILTENCLQELFDAFEQNPNCGFIYSDNAVYHMKNEFFPFNPLYGWSYKDYDWNGKKLISMNSFKPTSHSLSYIWWAPDHVRAWRRETYHEIGGHNVELSICDDHELLIRTYLNTEFYFIPKVLYIYRITGDNSWLERNEQIQTKTKELHNQYAINLAERDAELKGLIKLELGGGIDPYKKGEFLVIDQEDGDINCDLNEGIPLEDNSVGVIYTSHLIEHLDDIVFFMRECHRVLCHGGWLILECPSTDGRGAFQDPTHKTFINENSFWYYTRKDKARFIRNNDIRFMEMRLETNWWDNHIAVVNTHLVALKDGERFSGPIQI